MSDADWEDFEDDRAFEESDYCEDCGSPLMYCDCGATFMRLPPSWAMTGANDTPAPLAEPSPDA